MSLAGVFARLLHHGADFFRLRSQIAFVGDRRQLQLNEADDHAVRSLVQSAEPTHSHLLIFSIR